MRPRKWTHRAMEYRRLEPKICCRWTPPGHIYVTCCFLSGTCRQPCMLPSFISANFGLLTKVDCSLFGTLSKNALCGRRSFCCRIMSFDFAQPLGVPITEILLCDNHLWVGSKGFLYVLDGISLEPICTLKEGLPVLLFSKELIFL